MRQQPRPLDVAQELDAESVSFVRSFDQTGDIGDDEAAEVVELHHAELRFERRERIVRDLGPRRREARNERGFAGVRESDQSHIGEQLQLEPQPALVARLARPRVR